MMRVNLRGGWALIRSQMFGFLSSKGFFWTLAVGWMTGPLVYMLVWMTAAGDGSIGGFTQNDFLIYYLCLIIVNQLTYPTAHWSTAEMILEGSVSSALLRPMPLIYGAISCDMATKIVCLPFVLVFSSVCAVVLGMRFVIAPVSLLLAVLALLLSLAARFLLAYIISLLTFWTNRTSALLGINDTLVFLFAGQVAPLALFPDVLKRIAYVLPYRYFLSFPVELLMGKLSGADIAMGLLIQAVWVAALVLLQRWVMRRGIRRYSAIGG